jgi:hypothetical protein
VAKGNDGNYLQHSIEVAVALRLAATDPARRLHVALAHGMAPFETCDNPPAGQSRSLLERALPDHAQPRAAAQPIGIAAGRSASQAV